jgi:DNA-binding response OmpR family regulator
VPRIAVIDNDRTLVDLAAELFLDQGWDSDTYLEGSGAVRALSLKPPDVIILDLFLDGPETGWDILQRLKIDATTRDVPVIIWSGAVDRLRDKEDWLLAQGIPTLGKPFEITELYRLVEDALARLQSVRERS